MIEPERKRSCFERTCRSSQISTSTSLLWPGFSPMEVMPAGFWKASDGPICLHR